MSDSPANVSKTQMKKHTDASLQLSKNLWDKYRNYFKRYMTLYLEVIQMISEPIFPSHTQASLVYRLGMAYCKRVRPKRNDNKEFTYKQILYMKKDLNKIIFQHKYVHMINENDVILLSINVHTIYEENYRGTHQRRGG